jgi:hypothetical protein
MQKTVVNLTALLILLAGGGWTFAQKADDDKTKLGPQGAKAKKPAASGLETLLAEALKNNPDIQVAEASLHAAEAPLNRARLLVMQKVATYHHSLEAQKAQVSAAEANFKRMKELHEEKVISLQMLNEASAALVAAKAKLAEIEGELPYLLGKARLKKDDRAEGEWHRYLMDLTLAQIGARNYQTAQTRAVEKAVHWLERVQAAHNVRGRIAERLRKALDTPVPLKIEHAPLADVLEFLTDRVEGVSFQVNSGKKGDIKKLAIELAFKQPIPLGAAIQAIQDMVPGLRFAVREYGILVTWEDQLPPDALMVNDFWKGGAVKKSEGSADAKSMKKNPPINHVSGKVTQASADATLIGINLGSDDGLVQGHTLEVFRLQPKPVYLGTIIITAVRKDNAVGKPTEHRLYGKIRVGDRVASQIVKSE